MPNSTNITRIQIVTLVLVVFYVGYRAAALDITHDEAYSFLNIKKFWHVQFLCNANSHWLNSGAMKLADCLGFEQPFALRWLSFTSAIGFLTLLFFWIRQIKTVGLQLLAFSLAALNPFVLDYFALARGYASGLFFESLAIALLIYHLKSEKKLIAQAALLSAALSAIANFNFFYFFVAFSAVYFYLLYYKRKTTVLKDKLFYWDLAVMLGTIALVLRALLFIKRCSNDLGLGTDGFIKGIFASYIDGLLYKNYGENYEGYLIPSILLALLITISALVGIIKFRQHQNRLYWICSVIFLIISSAVIFNHLAFGLVYPYFRSSLNFFPVLVIVLVCFSDYLLSRKAAQLTGVGLSLLLILNFAVNINSHYTFDFYHQSDSKIGFNLVEKLGAKKIGMSHEHFGVYINYYQASDNYRYPFKGERLNTYDASDLWKEDSKLEDFDYLILYPPYELSYYKKRRIHFKAVTLLPFSKTVILKVEKL